jgi:hypothetical protein
MFRTLPAGQLISEQMTAERAKAYGRLMAVASTEGPEALEPEERSLLREAADSLFFCEDISLDEEAREALAQIGDLTGTLVGSERWDGQRAERVLQDLEACGPAQLVRLGD